MDVSSVANVAMQMSQQRTAQAADIAVLKKAMEVQQSGAMALLAALPTSASALPAHIGQNVNVVA